MYKMRVFYLTYIVLYSSSHLAQCSVGDKFVDPLDILNYDPSTKSMRKPTKSVVDPIQKDRCTVFLPRFVNILLKNTGLMNFDHKSNDYSKLKSHASVTITVPDLNLLKNMASMKEIDYTEIDRILNDMFSPINNVPGSKETLYSSVENMYFEVNDKLYWVSVGVASIASLYIIFRKFHHVLIIPLILTVIFVVIFVLSFASTWYTMYMKAEINRRVHLDHMPSHCFQNTGGWLSWFSTNNLDECKKYNEAIHLNPILSIALTEVLVEMFSKMMTKPIESLGNSIYIFNKEVLKDFPMWAQLILVPLIIITIIKTMLLVCGLYLGRHLSLKSMFGYGSTTIGPGPSSAGGLNSNPNINTHPLTSAQYMKTPDKTHVSFNINLIHPSQNNLSGNLLRDASFSIGNELKINHKKESNLISMLKNEEIDSVDSKNNRRLKVKTPRHRTLSI